MFNHKVLRARAIKTKQRSISKTNAWTLSLTSSLAFSLSLPLSILHAYQSSNIMIMSTPLSRCMNKDRLSFQSFLSMYLSPDFNSNMQSHSDPHLPPRLFLTISNPVCSTKMAACKPWPNSFPSRLPCMGRRGQREPTYSLSFASATYSLISLHPTATISSCHHLLTLYME